DKAVQDGVNSLTTATLTQSEIHNRAEYSASSIGIGGGYSYGGGGMMPVGGGSGGGGNTTAGGVGTNQQGQATTGGDKVPGSKVPTSGNWSATPPVVMGASGSGSSVTGSGISGGAIHITDDAKQQALTGKDGEQTVASVNRNVSTERDSSNALKPIFNEKEIQAGFEITGAFLREAGTFIGNRAKEAQDKERLAKDPNAKNPDGTPVTDEQRLQYAKEAQELKDTWGPGGTYRQIATALMAGAGGNVTGGMGNFVQNASVAYLQELGANQVKQIADALDSDTARAALHAVVGCAGAAASSQSCASGALGAAGGSIINNLLDQINKDKLTPEEKEARSNLVSSLIAGITAAAGGNAVTATNAARIETENNRLATSAEVKRIHQLSQGDPRKEARLTAAACALLHCEREYPEGSEAYNFYKRLSDAGSSPELAQERLLLESQKGFQLRGGLITGISVEPLFQYNFISDNVADAAKRVDNAYQLSTRALGGVQAVGGTATAIAGGTITAGGAASCGPTAGAGCLAAAGGVALSFWGLDQAKAGVATLISGQPQATVGGIVLQQVFGISPQAAELLYGVAGGVGGIAADAALARQAGTVLAPTTRAANPADLLPNTSTRVLTETEARNLGGQNQGLIYVTETPRGGTAAQEFQAGTPGAFSDLATGKPAVPALRYDNPNTNGVNFVKFDGIEKAADGTNVLLIDAKTKLATWSSSTQASVVDTLKRVEAALAQNPGYKVVYEFPNDKVARQAAEFIRNTPYPNVVSIRVRQ
ncbi:DUF637 domain-containing protein, partial [Ralstonia pseudosolanacearum]|uniref:DUF637 domain-containing protein n=1 Tax=Ralstonia pseudosolanacearum TaxID=1310165 RepID=UPI003CEDE015